MALISTGNGSTFQRRIDPGGFSVSTHGPSLVAPAWVRLVRSANQFTAYTSTDGVKWTTIATDTVPMGSAVFVGLAVTSHDASSRATSTIDQFKLTQASAPPNQAPVVSITAPAGGSTFTAPANITVTAQASDPENRLARVDLYGGSTRIASLTAAPFTATWSSVPVGTYAITAVAFDLDGGSTTSQPVTVNVSSTPNQAPTVGLSSPTAGATFTAPATIAIAASAGDPDGTVAKVEFYSGTTLLSTDTTSPFSFSWTNVAAGNYTLKAIAYDNKGASTTSATVSVSVTAATGVPTTVSFQKSADDATLVQYYLLEVFQSGADPNTATAVSALNLGKPTPKSSGLITLNEASFFNALARGSYIATVSAVGSGGKGRSAPVSFTR
jgi:hypothetical protein